MEFQPFLALLAFLLHAVSGQDEDRRRESTCQSMAYRKLSPVLQNEHMCLLLEQIHQELVKDKEDRSNFFNGVMGVVVSVEKKIGIVRDIARENQLQDISDAKSIFIPRDIPVLADCADIKRSGKVNKSGIYPIKLSTGEMTLVQCDMVTDGGGWTIIQRRYDGGMNFTRFWDEYKEGFGDPNYEYWLGNEKIHSLTNAKKYALRIDLWDWEGNTAYAQYNQFTVDSEDYNYRLHVKDYNGTAGDSFFDYHDNVMFSTPDSDNDEWYGHCAKKDGSGWWFRDCSYASLNGRYNPGGRSQIGPDGLFSGIHWYYWKRSYTYSLKQVEMKIKPLDDL